MEMLNTPLYAKHQALGARMVPFAGFLMPVSYSGIQEEHRAVRERAGLFDTSHMGCFAVRGVGARTFLNRVCVGPIAAVQPGQALYSVLCYPNGTIVDDIYVLCLGETEWRMVVNASNLSKDFNWLQGFLQEDVQLDNLSADFGILALQGPAAERIAQKVLGPEILEMSRNQCRTLQWSGGSLVVSRTGYTGEDGFELYPSADTLGALWDAILEAGDADQILPCGLGCRDTLRLECGLSLYGHELTERINLVEAGLSWTVDWNKPDFIGRDALLAFRAAPLQQRLVGLVSLEKALPREGCEVVKDDVVVGRVTSGGMSPTLQKGIALAFVKENLAVRGQTVGVVIRGTPRNFEIGPRRFLPKSV